MSAYICVYSKTLFYLGTDCKLKFNIKITNLLVIFCYLKLL